VLSGETLVVAVIVDTLIAADCVDGTAIRVLSRVAVPAWLSVLFVATNNGMGCVDVVVGGRTMLDGVIVGGRVSTGDGNERRSRVGPGNTVNTGIMAVEVGLSGGTTSVVAVTVATLDTVEFDRQGG